MDDSVMMDSVGIPPCLRKLTFINGKMNHYVYKGVLEYNLLSNAQKSNIKSKFVFHDNEHIGRSVMNIYCFNKNYQLFIVKLSSKCS